MSAARPQTDRELAEELGARYQQLKHEAKVSTEGLAPTLAQIAVLVPSLVATLTTIPEGETISEGEAWARFVEEEMRELGISDEQMQRYIARLRPLSNTPVDGIMAVFRLFLDELRERGRALGIEGDRAHHTDALRAVESLASSARTVELLKRGKPANDNAAGE